MNPGNMKTLYRVAHAILVLALVALLIRTVYYGLSLLRVEQHPQLPLEGIEDVPMRTPSPQEIVRYALRSVHACMSVANQFTGCLDEYAMGYVGRRSLQERMRSIMACVSPEALRRCSGCEKTGRVVTDWTRGSWMMLNGYATQHYIARSTVGTTSLAY